MTDHAHVVSGNPSRALTFTLTRADVRRLSQYIYFHRKPFWTAFRLPGYCALVAWGLDLFRREIVRQQATTHPAAMLSIALATPPLLIGVLLLAIAAVQFLGAYAPRPPDRRIVVTDDGVLSEQAEWSVLMSWASFIEIARDHQAIYGFMTPVFALILPRRAFASDDEMAAWFDRMERSWNEQRHSANLPPPPADAISMTYTADIKAYEKAYAWAARFASRKTRIIRAAVPAAAVLLVLALTWGDILNSPWLLLPIAPCLLLILFVPYGLARSQPRFLARQAIGIRGGLTPQVLSLTPEGLISRAATTWSRFPWRQIARIESDRDLIYFLLPGGSAAFVPRAAFLDRSEADSFLDAARAYQAGRAPRTGEAGVWPPRPQV